jgi:F-type H+-transporting ATPase subunit alpha
LTDAIKEYKGNFLADRAEKNKEQKETAAAK